MHFMYLCNRNMTEERALRVDIEFCWVLDSSMNPFKLGTFEETYCPKFICLGVSSAWLIKQKRGVIQSASNNYQSTTVILGRKG